MQKNKKCILILSGGLDSVTLLHDIVKQHGKENIIAISFNYGSKHNAYELPMAIYQTSQLKVEHRIIDMVQVFNNFNSALLNHENSEEIPEGHYEEKSMKKTVIPFRNGILLAIAAGVAETVGATKIYYGAHGGDHIIYPDCRLKFIKAMSSATKLGTYNKVKILAPYSNINKIKILKIGKKLGVDYSKTHTCYNPSNGKSCGKCGSCIERCAAFIINKMKDPIKYILPWEKQKKYTQKILNKKN